MDPTSNYTGAYLSDGMFQPSVPYGKAIPTSPLDAAARLHDTAYALYPNDKSVKFYADQEFKQHSDKIPGVKAAIAGQAVTKGNVLLNGAKKLITNVVKYGPLGAVKTVAENVLDSQHLIDSAGKSKKIIRNIAANDPMAANAVVNTAKSNKVTSLLPAVSQHTPETIVLQPTQKTMLKAPKKPKGNRVLPGGVNVPDRVGAKAKKYLAPTTPSNINNITVNVPDVRDKYYLDTQNGLRIPYTRKEYERQTQPKPKETKFRKKKISKSKQKLAFSRLYSTRTVLQNI